MKVPIQIKSYCLPILLVFFLNGCSSSSTGTGDNQKTEDNLLSLEFSKDSAAPFEAVTFTGLPNSKDPGNLWAEVIPDDGSEQYQTMIYKDNGEWFIRIPIYFSAPMAGGRVQVYIVGDDGTQTEKRSITIKPLSEEKGKFQDVVSSLSNLLTKYLETAGTSREELNSGDLSELSDVRIPLYLSYWVIDNPANENNLVSLSNGGAALQNFDNININYLDALSASLQIEALLDIAHQNIDSLNVRDENISALSNSHTSVSNLSNLISIGHQEKCANTLNKLMWAAEYADVFNSEAGQQILNKTGQALAGITILAPVPFTKGLSGTAGAVIFGLGNILSAIENLYPSKFIENDLVLSPINYPEDLDSGTWRLDVVAASNGWAVDKAILEGLLQYVGLKGVKNLKSVINTKSLDEGSEAFYDAVLGESLNQFISGAAGNPSDGLVRIPEQIWPCDITDLAEINIPLDQALIENPGKHDGLNTDKVGTARVRADKKEGKFGYQSPLSIRIAEVHAINVSVRPDHVYVEPGDQMFFDSEVQWANDTSVKWTTTGGEFRGADQQKSVVLQTPEEEWDEPIEVKVTSQSKGGLRGKKGAPPRYAVALVYPKKINIEIIPAWACLEKGEALTFQAEVTGTEGDPDVSWSASAGSFSGSTYSAPGSNVGNVTITATVSTEDGEVSESITIRVGECKCYWEAEFSGSLSGSAEGDYAVFERINAQRSGTQFTFWPSVEDNRPALFATHVPPVSQGGTGVLEALVTLIADNSANSDWVSLEDPQYEIRLPNNQIETNSNGRISGFLSGQLIQFRTNTNPPTIHFAGFSLRYVARRRTAGDFNPCD